MTPGSRPQALLGALAGRAVASAAVAAVRAAWRLGHRRTTRHRVVVPTGYATGRADLQLTHGNGPVASPPGHQPPCTSPTHSHWKDPR